jgi:hypothetical protein
MKKSTTRFKSSGEGLVIVLILIVLIGGGVWYLVSHKQSMEKEGRTFGNEVIKRIVIDHDVGFLSSNLSPQARLDLPPTDQQNLINQLQQLGIPAQPFKTDENFTWESHFFEPRGFFTAHLNYPGGPATLQIAFDHPVSKWQIVNISFAGPSMAR